MILFFALAFDLLFGDPPNRFHPTAWMGNSIRFLLKFRPQKNSFLEFLYGILILLIGIFLAAGAGFAIAYSAAFLPLWAGVLFQALFLKLTISLRGLDRAAKEVQIALQNNDLIEARRLLSWHLVSRDTTQLTEAQVCAGAIESVAENASDGIVAPLFFFAIGGLPAAFAYRFVNTADSMLGYRDPAREWLGKFPARFDDLLNFIPARLTGLFIVLSAPFCKASFSNAWKIMWRDSSQTASPNAGVPMSAMAGALQVELEKVDHYQLGKGLPQPQIAHLHASRKILFSAILLSALAFALYSSF
ncbi:MAG: cobalamin biosynthesis protein [Anaerolineales bacterium]|nr:cobalamin biosynthesis protein [Anaerolineales bacterium]